MKRNRVARHIFEPMERISSSRAVTSKPFELRFAYSFFAGGLFSLLSTGLPASGAIEAYCSLLTDGCTAGSSSNRSIWKVFGLTIITPSGFSMNSSFSPSLTLSNLRIDTGIVICPLLVTFAISIKLSRLSSREPCIRCIPYCYFRQELKKVNVYY